jgi:threonine synthase
MNFYSTNNKKHIVNFETAVMNGLAPDGGLYMPEKMPNLSKDFLNNIKSKSFQDIAYNILGSFTSEVISDQKLVDIIESTFTFPSPIISLSDHLHVLELFHGPTLAFKDFGARFMARTMEHFVREKDVELNILVATSGDTGSAVANGFYNVEGINVYILYPSGKVSQIQEKQLTTLDKNITALEIDGTFDDCQKLVKQAFLDAELNKHLLLSSANSINIARLLPQSIYYVEAFKQLEESDKKLVYSIPSGNLGNICAGLFAFKMGLPAFKFIGATNSNDVFTKYLQTGNFIPTTSHKTYSNAMDVGNPSNLDRIKQLYENDLDLMQKDLFSISHNDKDTLLAMAEVKDEYNYIIDPHGAVGYLAVKNFLTEKNENEYNTIILETAHPAKFKDVVEKSLNTDIEIPRRLKECITKEKHSIKISKDYIDFKDYLLSK